MSKNTNTPSFSDIYASLKGALEVGRKRATDIEGQIEAIEADAAAKVTKLRAEREKVLADNDRAESGLAAMQGDKPTVAKKTAAKKTAPVKAAKKTAASATPAPKAKPGPKPKAKAATPKATAKTVAKATKATTPKVTAKAVAKKAAPKATAKKAAKKTAAAKASNAAEGRRAVARGDRPTMREAMAIVIGSGQMEAAEIVEGLKKRNWMPNAEDPQQYVSYMLASNKPTFERISRGVYKVREGATFTKKAKKAEKAEAKKTETKKAAPAAPSPKAAAPKAAAANTGKKTTDEELGDLGLKTGGNVASNPFAANAS